MVLIDVNLDVSTVLKILEAPYALITDYVACLPQSFALQLTFLADTVSQSVQKLFFISKHLFQVAVFEIRPIFLEVWKCSVGVYHILLLVNYNLSLKRPQKPVTPTNEELIFKRVVDFLSERIHPQRAFEFWHVVLSISKRLQVFMVPVFPAKLYLNQGMVLHLHRLRVFHIEEQFE